MFSTYASVLLNIAPFLSIPGNVYEKLIDDYVMVVILLASFDMEFGSMSQFAKFSFTFIKCDPLPRTRLLYILNN